MIIEAGRLSAGSQVSAGAQVRDVSKPCGQRSWDLHEWHRTCTSLLVLVRYARDYRSARPLFIGERRGISWHPPHVLPPCSQSCSLGEGLVCLLGCNAAHVP